MSLFGKRGGIFGGPLGGPVVGPLGNLFDDGPSVIEKVEMLFTDVETEGKKQGYDRAAKEYGAAYRAIEKEFSETKKLIEQQKTSYDNKAETLINKLESLEKEKERLEREVDSKTRDVSRRFDIPISEVRGSLAAGTLLVGGPMISVDILGMIYKHKEKKLKEAEQRGYVEAKELYENKISKLKSELKRLKDNGDKDIKKLLTMIDEIFQAIAEEQMKIAELKILL